MPPRTRGRQAERPVKAVPDEPKRTNGVQFYRMPQRLLLGGEPVTLTCCSVCCAAVPDGEKAKARHAEWHRLLQEAVEAALPR